MLFKGTHCAHCTSFYPSNTFATPHACDNPWSNRWLMPHRPSPLVPRSALLCLVALCMSLATGPILHAESAASSRIQILRLYGVAISVLLMLVETESPWLLERVGRLLESWVGRALLQGLLVVMTLEFSTSAGQSDFDMSLKLYR